MAAAWAQVRTTLPTLRTSSMRRSSVRSSGTGMPLALRRSVGRTSGSLSAEGTMVAAGASITGWSIVAVAVRMTSPYSFTTHVATA